MLTTQQYEDAISGFTKGKRRILSMLYQIEPVADSKIIAEHLGYKGHQAANLHIGNIGRAISEHHSQKPDFVYEYKGEETPGYFSLVHSHDGENWVMVPELRQAVKNLGWV